MFNKKSKRKWEKICNSAIIHSSLGEFTNGGKNGPPKFAKGGHGEENIKELKRRGIDYNIVFTYPNGVRLGNVPSHKKTKKRTGGYQVWFPKSWTRNTIRKAGEKIINSIPYKLDDGKNLFGKYKKVKIAVKRTFGKVSTIFPYHKQNGGIKWTGKKLKLKRIFKKY